MKKSGSVGLLPGMGEKRCRAEARHSLAASTLALSFVMAVTFLAMAGMAADDELIPVKIERPSPAKWPGGTDGTTSPNLELDRGGKPYPQILVPKGCDQLLSRNCRVTSSDPAPPTGDLSFVTDGKKDEAVDENVRLLLNPGLQWIQIDLGAKKEIHAVCLWHSFSPRIRVYHDVIVQISDDPDFMDEVVTVFNNDHDNSAKLGTGKDFEYIETHEGRPIPASGAKGRYVRCYSNGNIRDKSNAYVEVEVYGRR